MKRITMIMIIMLVTFIMFSGCNSGNLKTASLDPLTEDYIYAKENDSSVKNFKGRAGDTKVYLEWDSVENAAGYRIFQYDVNEEDYMPVQYTTEPKKTVVYLENGIEYCFKVCAYTLVNGEEQYGSLTNVVAITPNQADILLIDQPFLVLKVNEKAALTCSKSGQPIEVNWRSLDEQIARVDKDGVVTAVGRGNVVITGEDNKKNTVVCTVIIDRQPEDLSDIQPQRYSFDEQTGFWTRADNDNTELVKLSFVGDIMSTWEQQEAAKKADGGFDFITSFKYVKDFLSTSDLVVGNLETTLSHTFPYAMDLHNFMNNPLCNSPASILNAIRYAGIDALVTSNNHSCDTGPTGIIETIDNLNKSGFIHTGISADKSTKRYELINVNGIKIGLISVNQKSYNGKESLFTEEELEYMVNQSTRGRMQDDIKDAKKDGAEFIIVYLHGGVQNSTVVTERQSEYSNFLANSGADVIIGAHPHVLQKFEIITTDDNRMVPVIYSLGNIISSMPDNFNLHTIIFDMYLSKENGRVEIRGFDYVPCYILLKDGRNKYVTVPIVEEYRGRIGDVVFNKASDYIADVLKLDEEWQFKIAP